MAATTERTTSRRRTKTQPWLDFAHTGPGTLAGRYMRRFWQPVFRAEDLKPGKAMPLQIMSEDFTLYRGETGTPHAVAFRCAHRGTQLSTGWVEGDNLRCRYHGWTYDGSGQCVEQPAELRPFCAQVRIRSYPTHEYLGLIFVYFGDVEPAPPPRFPDFEGRLEAHMTYRGCNYFSNIENACDEAHIHFTHRGTEEGRERLFVALPEISAEETEYGIARYRKRPTGETRVTLFGMPNMHHIAGASQSIHWRVPITGAPERGRRSAPAGPWSSLRPPRPRREAAPRPGDPASHLPRRQSHPGRGPHAQRGR